MKDRYGTLWTDAEKKRAADLWREGKTALQIGGILGRSRNAVLGHLTRVGLVGTKRPARDGETDGSRIPRITLCGPAWSVQDIPNCQHVGGAA